MWKTPFYGYAVDRELYLKVSFLKTFYHDAVREVLEESYNVQNGFFNYVNQFLSGAAFYCRRL